MSYKLIGEIRKRTGINYTPESLNTYTKKLMLSVNDEKIILVYPEIVAARKGLTGNGETYATLSAVVTDKKLYVFKDVKYGGLNRGVVSNVADVQLKDITSFSTHSYVAPSIKALIIGIIAAAIGSFNAMLAMVIPSLVDSVSGSLGGSGSTPGGLIAFFVILGVLLMGVGAFLIYGAFTFLKRFTYSITFAGGSGAILAVTGGVNFGKSYIQPSPHQMILSAFKGRSFDLFSSTINAVITAIQEQGEYFLNK